jgi:hypothetical protein
LRRDKKKARHELGENGLEGYEDDELKKKRRKFELEGGLQRFYIDFGNRRRLSGKGGG